jgi:hypothetical protein
VYGGFCEEEAGARFTEKNSLWDGNCTASSTRMSCASRLLRLTFRIWCISCSTGGGLPDESG